MRLDLYLKLSRLAPRRSLAQEMCEAGAVKLNGSPAKSAHAVRPGDQLAIRQRGRITTVRVLDIPSKQVSKSAARSLYETLEVAAYDDDLDWSDNRG